MNNIVRDRRRAVSALPFATLAFSQGCVTRQAPSVGSLQAPVRLTLASKEGFVIRQSAIDATTRPAECRVKRIEGILDRVSGDSDTLVFRQVTISGARSGVCKGSATSNVVLSEHPALRPEIERLDAERTFLSSFFLGPIIAVGALYVFCWINPCMS